MVAAAAGPQPPGGGAGGRQPSAAEKYGLVYVRGCEVSDWAGGLAM
jgi:hypothetical protein